MYPPIRLIALDLDGTLLDEEKKIPDQAVEMIAKAKAKGIIVTLASARPFCSMLPYARQLQLDAPLISLSGSYVTDEREERIWLRRPMNLLKFREMVRFFEEENYYVKVYLENQLIVQEPTKETVNYSRIFGVPYTALGPKKLRTLEKAPLRIALFDDAERIQKAQQILKKWSDDFAVIRDTDHGLEIVEPTVSKGGALKVICRDLRIPMGNVMAVGNEGSDISMIREAGIGIAMGNACKELKQFADDVTKTNEECGVGYAIQKFVFKEV
jgi:Cof subfamily protein (haloacid dehalogenase superfamily)